METIYRFRGWVLLLLCIMISGVYAPAGRAAQLLSTDVETAPNGCVMVGLSGSYYSQAQSALDRINEIRLEACRDGVADPRNTSRNLTMDDYVPLQWSTDLEYIARIRGAEATITATHVRSSGDSWWKLKGPSGSSALAEVLAWTGESMLSGIRGWYAEKPYWVDENRRANSVTSHYTIMIDPDYRYIGLGFFSGSAGYTVSGELSKRSSSGSEMLSEKYSVMQKLTLTTSAVERVSISGDLSLAAGEAQQLQLLVDTVWNGAWTKRISGLPVVSQVQWTSSDVNAAIINDSGLLTMIDPGRTFTITATAGGLRAEITHEGDDSSGTVAPPSGGIFPGGDTEEETERETVKETEKETVRETEAETETGRTSETSHTGSSSSSQVILIETPVVPSGQTSDTTGRTSVTAASGIAGRSGNKTIFGGSFLQLQLKAVPVSSTSVKLHWKRISGASSYLIFGARSGKNTKFEQLGETAGSSYTQKHLKKGTYYKYIVAAVDGSRTLSVSQTVHVASKGGKASNAKKITVNKSSVKLKKGKSFRLKAKVKKQSYGRKITTYRAVAFESSDTSVASVSSKGVIKAKKKGSCYVYVYAQDGVSKKIKVTVK